jgi:hypothetical protein
MAGCAIVIAVLDPAISSRTVRGEPVPHRLSGDGRVKPGHDEKAPSDDEKAPSHDEEPIDDDEKPIGHDE